MGQPPVPEAKEGKQMTLTAKQRFALEWIGLNDCYESEWIKNWTAIQLTGDDGSIVISKEDWDATQGLHEPNPPRFRPIWRLSDAGRAALQHEAKP